MIHYSLICEQGHDFDGWFQNSDGFDDQAQRGLINCPICASSKVTKAIMAPRVARRDNGHHQAQLEALRTAISGQMGDQDAREQTAGPQERSAPENRGLNALETPEGPVRDDMRNALFLRSEHQELRAKIKAFRDELHAKTVDVEDNFAQEARAIHDGDRPERPIRGQATLNETRALLEDGIPILPIPSLPEDHH